MMRVSTCVIFKPVLIASTASVQEPLALARRCVEKIPWHGIQNFCVVQENDVCAVGPINFFYFLSLRVGGAHLFG